VYLKGNSVGICLVLLVYWYACLVVIYIYKSLYLNIDWHLFAKKFQCNPNFNKLYIDDI
jgi:hypothetical protein